MIIFYTCLFIYPVLKPFVHSLRTYKPNYKNMFMSGDLSLYIFPHVYVKMSIH